MIQSLLICGFRGQGIWRARANTRTRRSRQRAGKTQERESVFLSSKSRSQDAGTNDRVFLPEAQGLLVSSRWFLGVESKKDARRAWLLYPYTEDSGQALRLSCAHASASMLPSSCVYKAFDSPTLSPVHGLCGLQRRHVRTTMHGSLALWKGSNAMADTVVAVALVVARCLVRPGKSGSME
ncbi:uncharacterized protein BKA78DRAFT_159329 [Phyllosticta capitalensis]|uniref:uncharacterized protein n=1 Tax=Phyllosticta capitalensis TaxID=121624 RepID=UPI00313032F3